MAAAKRKALTLSERLAVIQQAEEGGASTRDLAMKFGVGRTQIATILKRKAEILEEMAGAAPLEKKRNGRCTGNEPINELCLTWFVETIGMGIKVTGPMLKKKALEVANELGIFSFSASNGWLQSFIKRNERAIVRLCNKPGDGHKDLCSIGISDPRPRDSSTDFMGLPVEGDHSGVYGEGIGELPAGDGQTGVYSQLAATVGGLGNNETGQMIKMDEPGFSFKSLPSETDRRKTVEQKKAAVKRRVTTATMSNNGDVVLFYAHPSMRSLARDIANCCYFGGDSHNGQGAKEHEGGKKKRVKLQKSPSAVTTARHVEFRDTIQWKKFADGFPNLFIEDVKYMAGKDVIFIGSFHSPDVVFEQLSVLYSFPRYLSRSFHFILPYFPTGTMERVDTEGQIATAKTLATLISNIPLSARGPAQVIIYDIHALQERFYFSDNVIPRLETAIPLLKRALTTFDQDNLMYAFPDDGAYKRFHCDFDDSKLIVCVKKREGNKRVIHIKDGDPRGKHVVIIDDLVQSGGTLRQCGKALLEGGATGISAYVTHPVFPDQSWKKFTEGDPRFDNFWITNSIPHAEEIAKHPPFKLLSLSDVIAENLLGFDLMPS